MASPAIKKAASAAIAPKTPSAIASGLLDRSTCPSVTEVTWKAYGRASRDESDDLVFDRGYVAAALPETEPVARVCLRPP